MDAIVGAKEPSTPVRTSSLRDVCQYSTGDVFQLVYTTAACLPDALRTERV